MSQDIKKDSIQKNDSCITLIFIWFTDYISYYLICLY